MIEVHDKWGVTILKLGESHTTLDASAGQVRKTLERLSGSRDRLLLDFSQTKRVDAGFLGAMVRAWKRIKQRKGEFALCAPSEAIAEMLALTKLTSLWPTYPSRAAALDSLVPVVSSHAEAQPVPIESYPCPVSSSTAL